VPLPPGAGSDFTARLIGQWLSERLGQQFIIENRPGGGANIGTEAVVRAPPDGYTLLLTAGANVVNTTLLKLNFNFIRDIAPVASVARVPNVMVVNPSVPAKTVPEFVAYAKANPGKINMASAGIGGPTHVAGELFKTMTDVNMAHVPFRGGAPAITDLIGGQVQVIFGGMSGRASEREAVVTANARSLPALTYSIESVMATVGEFVPGFEASFVFGIGAPKNTPPEIIDKLNKEINAALADPKIKARLAYMGRRCRRRGARIPHQCPARLTDTTFTAGSRVASSIGPSPTWQQRTSRCSLSCSALRCRINDCAPAQRSAVRRRQSQQAIDPERIANAENIGRSIAVQPDANVEVDLLGACDAIAAPWPVLIRRNDGQAGAKVVMHSMQRATRIQGSSVRDKRVESRSTLSVRRETRRALAGQRERPPSAIAGFSLRFRVQRRLLSRRMSDSA
jgi:tripartite-type tricarboxylate transporter receptor subunit TctC